LKDKTTRVVVSRDQNNTILTQISLNQKFSEINYVEGIYSCVWYAEANEYLDIKKVFDELMKFEDEKIVLKKI